MLNVKAIDNTVVITGGRFSDLPERKVVLSKEEALHVSIDTWRHRLPEFSYVCPCTLCKISREAKKLITREES